VFVAFDVLIELILLVHYHLCVDFIDRVNFGVSSDCDSYVVNIMMIISIVYSLNL